MATVSTDTEDIGVPTCVPVGVGHGIIEIDCDKFSDSRDTKRRNFGESNSFSFQIFEGITWRISYSYSYCFGQSIYLKLSLCLVQANLLSFFCIFKGWVLNVNSEKVIPIPKRVWLFDSIDDQLRVFLPNAEMYLVNNKIKISFELTVMFLEKTLMSSNCSKGKGSRANSLTNDLAQLLENDCGDMTMSVNGKKLKVHKTIVGARSPVLGARLNEVSICNEHVFNDVGYDVMKTIVRYMYTDLVDSLETNARKLYPAACKFGLFGLKEQCEVAIENSMSVENSAETLILADTLSKGFKARIIEFMKDNFKNVTPTAGFKSMVSSHPHLFMEVCCVVHDVQATPGAHKAA